MNKNNFKIDYSKINSANKTETDEEFVKRMLNIAEHNLKHPNKCRLPIHPNEFKRFKEITGTNDIEKYYTQLMQMQANTSGDEANTSTKSNVSQNKESAENSIARVEDVLGNGFMNSYTIVRDKKTGDYFNGRGRVTHEEKEKYDNLMNNRSSGDEKEENNFNPFFDEDGYVTFVQKKSPESEKEFIEKVEKVLGDKCLVDKETGDTFSIKYGITIPKAEMDRYNKLMEERTQQRRKQFCQQNRNKISEFCTNHKDIKDIAEFAKQLRKERKEREKQGEQYSFDFDFLMSEYATLNSIISNPNYITSNNIEELADKLLQENLLFISQFSPRQEGQFDNEGRALFAEAWTKIFNFAANNNIYNKLLDLEQYCFKPHFNISVNTDN
jgi:hypothetical protein